MGLKMGKKTRQYMSDAQKSLRRFFNSRKYRIDGKFMRSAKCGFGLSERKNNF